MRIIADSLELCGSMLGNTVQWQHAPRDIKDPLVSSIFPDNRELFTGRIDEKYWQTLYISEHAADSQFELLCRLMRAGKLHSDSIICCAGSGENFKGYRNRSWISVDGNLHLSAYFRPDRFIEHFEVGFTIMAAVSLVQAIDGIPALAGRSEIKWVNDIQIDRAKIGGVITHTQVTGKQINGVVIGLGLNVESLPQVTPDIFVPKVGTLSQFFPCTRQAIFRPVIRNLYRNYISLVNGGYYKLLDIYRRCSSVTGRRVQLYTDPLKGEPEFQGTAGRCGAIAEQTRKNTFLNWCLIVFS
jgi:biotin-[acetyl-CoA-carboxylase] ligase BirA-like protein